MNGWNRLFVLITVCWVVIAPFLVMADANKPVEQTLQFCSETAYYLYGSSASPHLDMSKYEAERTKCGAEFARGFVSLPKLLDAMIGRNNWELGAAAWWFILLPLALLWIVAWVVGRIGYWIAAGFRR